MTNWEKTQEILDTLMEEFDKKRMGVDVWDDYELNDGSIHPYLECTKSIEKVKLVLEKHNVGILKEFTSYGSDYNSYIIVLDLSFEDDSDNDEEYQVQFANDDGEIFDGDYFETFEEAQEYAISQYHSDPDYTHFVIYDADGEIVADEDDLTNGD